MRSIFGRSGTLMIACEQFRCKFRKSISKDEYYKQWWDTLESSQCLRPDHDFQYYSILCWFFVDYIMHLYDQWYSHRNIRYWLHCRVYQTYLLHAYIYTSKSLWATEFCSSQAPAAGTSHIQIGKHCLTITLTPEDSSFVFCDGVIFNTVQF